ncbi:MAG: radical SAM family heme chaperone HemW [Fimbriimonadales bacterium]|nr:radical SAM family heme chaperone HemW [Fimbriimonadales bacterium]
MSRPIAVYVHVPFCVVKCGYCDFNSYAMAGPIVGRTVAAMRRQIQQSPWRGRPAQTVFFGGGTPSLLPPDMLRALFEAVLDAHPPLPELEATAEANPESATLDQLRAMRSIGFNRLSLGVQSFDPGDLRRLDRAHGPEDAERAARDARRAGFERLNLDLMFGLEGQSLEDWDRNLDRALALRPDHLSLYNLTIEPGTRFERLHREGRLNLPDEEVQAAMYVRCAERLEAEGFRQYEISNYAKPGQECRHNVWVWRGGEYAAYGPGGVACVLEPQGWVRRTNLKKPLAYCLAVERGEPPWQEVEAIDDATRRFEEILLGLRLNEGIPADGLPEGPLRAGESRGWLERAEGRVRLTPQGRLYANDATSLFL